MKTSIEMCVALQQFYDAFIEANELPKMSADDLLFAKNDQGCGFTDTTQEAVLESFIELWELLD